MQEIILIACSEPEKIEKFNLLRELEISNQIKQNYNENNKNFILNFQKRITSLISENRVYAKPLVKLNENLKKVSEYELLHRFLVMQNFKQLTGIQWLISLT